MGDIPRFLALTLSTLQRAVETDDFSALGTINEHVQPVADAVVRRIRALRADVQRLTAERAALLAPIEDTEGIVDVEEVLRLGDAYRALAGIPPAERTTGERADLVNVAESLALDAPALAREVARLRAALEEARLTLAAEQGRPEGAPSEGWVWRGRRWLQGSPSGVTLEVVRYRDGWRWLDGRGNTGEADTAREAMIEAGAILTEAR